MNTGGATRIYTEKTVTMKLQALRLRNIHVLLNTEYREKVTEKIVILCK